MIGARGEAAPDAVRTWIGFAAMCVGMFMSILDIQVVASSLTNIKTALAIPTDWLSWIQTSYLIAEVIAIPLTGWLTRSLSLRWLFSGATLGFTLASLACAGVSSFGPLIVFRVIQGFCGGMLIPSVFTSIFSMMPDKDRVLATTIAGTFAMIAPTLGPWVGGYLTESFNWHWIFLVNVPVGFVVTMIVVATIRHGEPRWSELGRISYATIVLAAIFLASLELLLKEAPKRDWQGSFVLITAIVCLLSAGLTLYQNLNVPNPVADLRRFRDLSFGIGSGLSFVFGMGLYGSVYLLSIFLGFVRGHSPLVIGEIMMVSGIAQLLMAPVAAVLETRVDPRLLTGVGFGMFGLGLLTNGFADVHTDFWGLFWPQVLRGMSVMLCILPATRLALDTCPPEEVPDASALFNLMRNLGGAIGIALVDTVLEQRTQGHFMNLATRLQAGDPAAARVVGLPVSLFHNKWMGPVDPVMRAIVEPMIRKAALAMSFNEAWLILAALFALSLLSIPLMRKAHLTQSLMGPGASSMRRVF
jgi:DHA2 family multidrug resistance protein